MATTRVHWDTECENTSGNDTLALTTEDRDKVNCSDCLHVMSANGVFGSTYDERVWI